MVLDDDAALRRSLLIRLRREGYDVLDAEHPESAIHTVLHERPDLILLDIEMQHYNGLGFQECLQFSERARGIPIIYISGAGSPPNRKDAFRMGARAFVTKP